MLSSGILSLSAGKVQIDLDPQLTGEFNGGTPILPSGKLACCTSTTRPHYADGLTYDGVTGALLIASTGAVTHYANGMPITATGAVRVDEGGTPAYYNGGMPLSSTGLCVYSLPTPPIVIDAPDQTNLVEGQAFALALSTYVTQTDGDPITLYEIVTGTLPPGLALNSSSGLISGTPTTPGTSNVTWRAKDRHGNSQSDAIQFIVASAVPQGNDYVNITNTLGFVVHGDQGTTIRETAYKLDFSGAVLTAQKVFGASSLDYANPITLGQSVYAGNGTSWFLQFRVRFNAFAANQVLFSFHYPSTSNTSPDFYVKSSDKKLWLWSGGQTLDIGPITNSAFVINTWYAIAIGWDNTNSKLYVWVDGVRQSDGTTTYNNTWTGTKHVRIGYDAWNSQHLDGYIDEVRFLRGQCLFNTNYVIETIPFRPNTYYEFQHYIDVILPLTGSTVQGVNTLSSPSNGVTATYVVRPTTSDTGSMNGTPWGGLVSNGATWNRIVQHCLPAYANFLEQVSHSTGSYGQMYVTATGMGSQTTTGLDRNSYTSSAGALSSATKVTQILYWDFTLDKARVMEPFNQVGPTDLVW